MFRVQSGEGIARETAQREFINESSGSRFWNHGQASEHQGVGCHTFLYDDVLINGKALSLAHCPGNNAGVGWSAANCMLWNCNASVVRCSSPPGARNWQFGSQGSFEGDGFWRNSNNFSYDGGQLGGVVVLEGTAELRSAGNWEDRLYRELQHQATTPVPIRLIPYFAWGNRGEGEMTVWIHQAR